MGTRVHHDPSPCCSCENQGEGSARSGHKEKLLGITVQCTIQDRPEALQLTFDLLVHSQLRSTDLKQADRKNPVTNTHRGRRQLFTLGVKIASYHWNKALMSLLCICCICRVFHHSLN